MSLELLQGEKDRWKTRENTERERRKIRAERRRRKQKKIKNGIGANSRFGAQTFLLVIAEELIKYKC